MCGNIKGLHDPYRNPTTQEGFARQWGQKPHMVTSFADGTKISFEQAIVANATGMRVAQRGMWGPTVPSGTPLDEAIKSYPPGRTPRRGHDGFVDYLVGAVPGPGVFVIGTARPSPSAALPQPLQAGAGTALLFYTPYHLCHFEVPTSVARAVLFRDAVIAAAGTRWWRWSRPRSVDLAAGTVWTVSAATRPTACGDRWHGTVGGPDPADGRRGGLPALQGGRDGRARSPYEGVTPPPPVVAARARPSTSGATARVTAPRRAQRTHGSGNPSRHGGRTAPATRPARRTTGRACRRPVWCGQPQPGRAPAAPGARDGCNTTLSRRSGTDEDRRVLSQG